MRETEVKLRWNSSPADAQAHIEKNGFSVKRSRTLESDQLFDTGSSEMRASDQILRLRRSGDKAIVTYKGPAERGPYKDREEIEFEVSDPHALIQVIEKLGYKPTFLYQKYRTKFVVAGEPGEVTLDETPIGTFLELEGPKYWIDSTAKRLGFTESDYVTASYAALYRDFRSKKPEAPCDMIFSA